MDYLPPVLREVREFQTINAANEPEFVLAWAIMALILDNQFLETATEWGVSVWEQELRIYPKDTDTLETRKLRIKAKWGMRMPYTITWLRNWITGLCGVEGHSEWTEDYHINIRLDFTVLENAQTLMREILDLLLSVRPSNMLLQMIAALESTGGVHIGACSEMAGYLEIWPQLVTELESTGSNALNAYGYLANHMEVWPQLISEMESTGQTVAVSALTYHAAMEIYPRRIE